MVKVTTKKKNFFRSTPLEPKILSPLALLTMAACGSESNETENTSDPRLSFSINENALTLAVGSVVADLEDFTTSTYSLAGDDAAAFELTEEGELSLKSPANFEQQSNYSITINVTTTTPSTTAGAAPIVSTASRDYVIKVINSNDPASGELTLVGTAKQGEIIRADTSSIIDEDGVGPMIYQWFRDGELISDQVSSELTLTQSEVGSSSSAVVSYLDGSGTTETFESISSPAVNNTNDSPTGTLTIIGTLSENRELSVETSGITDADGLGEFTFQWHRDGVAIEGATAATYTLTESDVGTSISVSVSYIDDYGTPEILFSAETLEISKANDAPTGALIIRGLAAEGESLSLDTSSIGDIDGVGTFSYVWMKDGQILSGETSETYNLTQSDVGSVFSARVSYVDGLGVTEILNAEPTAAIINVNDDPTGNLLISGDAKKGSTLTLDSSEIADEDGLGEFAITWLSDGTPISGENELAYTLTEEDVGATISAKIVYTDGQGTIETITSGSTTAVRDVIVESVGAVRAVNVGSGTNMVLEFFVDQNLITTAVTSFDAVVTFDTSEATLVTAQIETAYLGFPNANGGVVNLSGISLSGGSTADPLFTISLTDLNTVDDLAVYVSDVLVNNQTLDGSTLLIA